MTRKPSPRRNRSPKRRRVAADRSERSTRAVPRTRTRARKPTSVVSRVAAGHRVSDAELRALRREIVRKNRQLMWNPNSADVQRSVAQLVLTIVEFLRQLMERQALRRMEQRTLTPDEIEAVGKALMDLEKTIAQIGAKFGLTAEDLNIDLGPMGKLI